MSGRDLILLAVFIEIPFCVAVIVWADRHQRRSRARSRDLHRRLSWYLHGRDEFNIRLALDGLEKSKRTRLSRCIHGRGL